jgi:hypothetical protein
VSESWQTGGVLWKLALVLKSLRRLLDFNTSWVFWNKRRERRIPEFGFSGGVENALASP